MKIKRKSPTAFIYQVIGLLSMIVLTGISGSAWLIYLRKQNTESKRAIQANQEELTDVRRKLKAVNVEIAEAITLPALNQRIVAMGIPLSSPERNQVVRLAPLPEVENPYSSETSAGTPTAPYSNPVDMAVVEPFRRMGN